MPLERPKTRDSSTVWWRVGGGRLSIRPLVFLIDLRLKHIFTSHQLQNVTARGGFFFYAKSPPGKKEKYLSLGTPLSPRLALSDFLTGN